MWKIDWLKKSFSALPHCSEKKLKKMSFSSGGLFRKSLIVFCPLREKCPNPELFLVRIFLYSNQNWLRIWTLFTQRSTRYFIWSHTFECWNILRFLSTAWSYKYFNKQRQYITSEIHLFKKNESSIFKQICNISWNMLNSMVVFAFCRF